MVKRPIFKDPKLQATYERDGFVIVKLLNDSDIQELLNAYHQFKKESDLTQGFHATIHSHKVAYRRKVSEKIMSIFTPRSNKYLLNYKPIFANYTVKEPGGGSKFDIHLDWSMVNEDKFVSVTVWCPLIDITNDNGYLWVLKGSHKFDATIRGGPGLHIHTANPFKEGQYKFERVILKLPAGTAYIYDHRIFHGSPDNLTNKTRIAINHTMIPTETESWHYHFLDKETVEIFEVDADFYNRHIIFSYPEGVKSLGTRKVTPNYLNQDQIHTLY